MKIAELGADFLGLNFWPQSKRHIPLQAAQAWAAEVAAQTALVGLFVNHGMDEVRRTVDEAHLSYAQLHGDESPAECAGLVAAGISVIKAFQVRDASSLDAIAAYEVNDILLDAYHPGQRGGIGQTFPWDLALAFKERYPERILWLAGGLTPDNIAEAVQGVRPQVVDVAGGVEDGTPGIKSLEKVTSFIQQARSMQA